MDFSKTCRTCLGVKYLVPIFQDSGKSSDFRNSLFSITGLKVEPNDGLPQKICKKCAESINKTLQFKEIALTTQSKLLNIKRSTTSENQLETIFTLEKIKAEVNHKTESDDEDDMPLVLFLNNSSISEIKIDNVAENVSSVPNADVKPVAKVRKLSKITCGICYKEVTTHGFNNHMAKIHLDSDRNMEACQLCNKSYTIKRAVFYCKDQLGTKEKLVNHIKKCSNKKVKIKYNAGREVVECDICHKKMQRNSVRFHKRIQHAGLGPVCEHCGVKFANKVRLSEHYRAKHGYEKFKCTHCEFQCSGAVALKNHERRRHLGEKPYVCETCGAKFHATYLLTQHKQSHRTERNVKCNLCPSAFKTNNSLHMHKLTCHSNKTFQCPMCPRTYPCRHYVVKHLRHTHRFKGEVPALERVNII